MIGFGPPPKTSKGSERASVKVEKSITSAKWPSYAPLLESFALLLLLLLSGGQCEHQIHTMGYPFSSSTISRSAEQSIGSPFSDATKKEGAAQGNKRNHAAANGGVGPIFFFGIDRMCHDSNRLCTCIFFDIFISRKYRRRFFFTYSICAALAVFSSMFDRENICAAFSHIIQENIALNRLPSTLRSLLRGDHSVPDFVEHDEAAQRLFCWATVRSDCLL